MNKRIPFEEMYADKKEARELYWNAIKTYPRDEVKAYLRYIKWMEDNDKTLVVEKDGERVGYRP